MDTPKSDAPKLPDMVMCGDHPSFTKTELNINELKMDDKDKEKEKLKDKPVLSYAKISPTSSRTEGGAGAELSEHTLRTHEPRRRARELERPELAHLAVSTNRPIVQGFPLAALGSFRWPPYLLATWVLVLVLTHALHCLVSVLERALPALKRCTHYFKTWTEETWKGQSDINQKVYPVALAAITAVLYTLYFGLYAFYGVVVWSIEPLCSEGDDSRVVDIETRVTDYVDNVNSKTSSNIKQ